MHERSAAGSCSSFGSVISSVVRSITCALLSLCCAATLNDVDLYVEVQCSDEGKIVALRFEGSMMGGAATGL